MVNKNFITLARNIIDRFNKKLNLIDNSDEILMQQESVFLIDERFLYDKRNY